MIVSIYNTVTRRIHTDFYLSSINNKLNVLLTGSSGSKVRRLESRQIKDYFGKFESVSSSGSGGQTTSTPSTVSTGVQTELTVHRLVELEGQSQNSSQVSSLQLRVTELEHFLTLCKEKLESTTARLNKCLTVGRELLIEKVKREYHQFCNVHTV